jgi:hypothetical protein
VPSLSKYQGFALAGLLLALGALVGGFWIDFEGFAGNALAELAGVLISVLLAVFVVDRLLEDHRATRWALVSDQTLRTLDDALVRAGLALYLQLPAPRPSSADPFTMQMTTQAQLVGAFHELSALLSSTSPDALAQVDDWVPDLGEQMRLVRDGVMPRLLALGDATLVAEVAAVEGAFQDLLHEVWVGERVGNPHLTDVAGTLLEKMATALDH